MQISASTTGSHVLRLNATGARIAESGGQQHMGDIGGILTDSDLKMIKAVTGTDFSWPPGPNDLIQLEAWELSYVRLRESIAGGPLNKLQASDISALGRSGQLDPDFVSDAVKYLQNESSGRANAADRPVHDLRKGAVNNLAQPGDVASDGSIYL